MILCFNKNDYTACEYNQTLSCLLLFFKYKDLYKRILGESLKYMRM